MLSPEVLACLIVRANAFKFKDYVVVVLVAVAVVYLIRFTGLIGEWSFASCKLASIAPHILNNLNYYIIVIAAIHWCFPLRTIMTIINGAIKDLHFKDPL